MRKVYGIAAAAIFMAGSAYGAEISPDDTAIRAVEQRQQDAWNAHDGHAYAALFTEDTDVVNVLGWWWKGRGELEHKLSGAFASVFAKSALTVTDVDVRYLEPGIAIAHVRWTMTGAKTPTGDPSNLPEVGLQTQVLQKRDGAWLIAAFQNTNGVPEKPFPGAPQ
jgi:uncharacterized protein (TIGR02246 family)